MKYNKPFRTYDEQIIRLKKVYKLDIRDNEFARHALSTVSYYDLINGYQETFIENGKFIEGISIEFLYIFHLFDKDFQNILFKQSKFIENMFKTKLAYILSKNHGVSVKNYLDEKVYKKKHGKIEFKDLSKQIKRVYTKEKNHKSIYIPDPTYYYLKNHNHIPAWILFRNISFADTINLYSLLKTEDKIEVTNSILPDNTITPKQKIEYLIRSLNLIRKFRNRIAHNLKFVNYQISKRYQLQPKVLMNLDTKNIVFWKDINKEQRGLRDVFGMILSIITLLGDDFLVKEFLKELYSSISYDYIPEKHPDYISKKNIVNKYLSCTNLPINLEERILPNIKSLDG